MPALGSGVRDLLEDVVDPDWMRARVASGTSWMHRRLIYPSVIWLRGEGSMYARLRELEKAQEWPPERLRRRQDARLGEALDHAWCRCPHYRRRWDSEPPASPDEARAYLRELPLLTKRDLQKHADGLAAHPRPRRITRKTTGGSTGEPVTVLKDREALARERAASWLAYGWFGVRIGDRGARFWGSPEALGRRRLRYLAADVAMHRIRFSAFAFDEADLDDYWERCLRFRPDYFYGYVSMLESFARHVRDRGHDPAELELKAVITTAEALTPPQRRLISETFGAPVQNEYGCGEFGPIAYECPEGSLHVMSENLLVELLGPEGEPVEVGETGEVVITDLGNRAMPLVRYRVGDHAVRGEEGCSCGRSFPVLEKVWGREYEFVRDAEGRRYHGEFFMYLFEDLAEKDLGVERFRVVQVSESDLRIEVKTDRDLSEEQEAYIRDYVTRRTTGLRPEIVRVPQIERAASGKHSVIRNEWLRNGHAA